jgi:magnesium-transporting ATPase (P-type)
LTGESTPMVKISFDVAERTSEYNNITHKKHTLSAGTRVLEAGTGSLALVLSTGSYTFKGGFLRDILNYNRHEFKFDTEVKIVLMILFIYGIFGFSITVHLYQDNFAYEFFYGMFVFATCLVSDIIFICP